MLIALIIALVIILLLVITGVKVVPQAKAFVVERFGAYHATWDTGIHFRIPIVDRISKRVSMKEQVVDFAPQPVITKIT